MARAGHAVRPMSTHHRPTVTPGFHWNQRRQVWQHPCGVRAVRSGGDPRSYYQVTPTAAAAGSTRSTGGRNRVCH